MMRYELGSALYRQSCCWTGLSSSSEQKNGTANYFENLSDGGKDRREADRMEVRSL